MAKLDLVITLGERAEIAAAARSLTDRGLSVEKTFPRSNTIIGTGDSSLLESFKRVDGVEDIRHEQGFRLPTMDEKTPQ